MPPGHGVAVPVPPANGAGFPEVLPWAVAGTKTAPSASVVSTGHLPYPSPPPDSRVENWQRDVAYQWLRRLTGAAYFAERAVREIVVGGAVDVGDSRRLTYLAINADYVTTGGDVAGGGNDSVAVNWATAINASGIGSYMEAIANGASIYLVNKTAGSNFAAAATTAILADVGTVNATAAISDQIGGAAGTLTVRTGNLTGLDFVHGGNALDGAKTGWQFRGSKAGAFRAGTWAGTQGDAANTGNSSAAFGDRPIASGDNSFAQGRLAIASASYTSAMGDGAQATGIGNSARGSNARATGAQNAHAQGDNALASGSDAYAAGLNATAAATASTAIGPGANVTAGATSGVALGTGSVGAAGVSGIALQGTASALRGIAAGANALASGDDSVAIGGGSNGAAGATASAARAVALGNGADATAADAVALGSGAQATAAKGVALGFGALASAASGIAIGDATANPVQATAAGGMASGAPTVGQVTAAGVGSRAHGDNVDAPGAYTDARGLGVLARVRGERATSPGLTDRTGTPVAGRGFLQRGDIGGGTQTTDATTGVLVPGAGADTWSPESNGSWQCTADVVARQIGGAAGTVGDSGMWHFRFALRKTGAGVISIEHLMWQTATGAWVVSGTDPLLLAGGGVAITAFYLTAAAAWTLTLDVVAGEAIQLIFAGEANKTIRVGSRIDYVQVTAI